MLRLGRKSKKIKNQKRDRKYFGMWLFFTFVALFVVFIGRFAYIAVAKRSQGNNIEALAQQRYTSSATIQAKRGKIFDINGNALATNTNRYTVYAVLSHSYRSSTGKKLYVQDKHKTAKVLAKELGISQKKVYKLLNPKNKKTFQVQFGAKGTNLTASEMLRIKDHHLPGVEFMKVPARSYPEGNFLSQILGQTAMKTDPKTRQDKLVGTMGIEQAMNHVLTGENGIKSVSQDIYGYRLTGSETGGRKVKNGGNVYTTIDSQIQNMLETSVESVSTQVRPESMTAVIADAKTGRIIAATQRPNLTSDNPSWVNALTQTTYEPGSVMKIFALSAAIDAGKFDPNKTFTSGTYAMGGGRITDWQPSGWGIITYREAIDRSSNVGFAHIEQDMGAKTWRKYIHRFGFLAPVEMKGLGPQAAGQTGFKGLLEQANTSFGQGITVTGMQVIQALTAIANDGKMMQPYIISKVTDAQDNVVSKTKPKVVGTPVKEKTARQVRNYLKGVIYNDDGTGQVYKVDGYTIAGKTGTAQIASPNGGYEKGEYDYIYSFAGFAPANHPRYIIYVTMKKPKNNKQAPEKNISQITTPIIKFLLDRDQTRYTKNPGTIKIPNVVGKDVEKAQNQLTKRHLTVTVLGSQTKVKSQSITPQTRVMVNQRIFLLTGGKIQMPDLKDWSQADVQALSQVLQVPVKITGQGYVTNQSIKPGQVIKANQTLVIQLKQK